MNIEEKIDKYIVDKKLDFLDKEFEKDRSNITTEIENTKAYSISGIKRLKSIPDPKKFIKAYMKLTGASKYDLPVSFLRYL